MKAAAFQKIGTCPSAGEADGEDQTLSCGVWVVLARDQLPDL